MWIDCYGRQSGAHKRGIGDIVEANDAKVFRHAPSAFDKPEDDSKSAYVVVANRSGWRIFAAQKFTNRPAARLARRRASYDWPRFELSSAKRIMKSRKALACN
jgi:hypothetical protein